MNTLDVEDVTLIKEWAKDEAIDVSALDTTPNSNRIVDHPIVYVISKRLEEKGHKDPTRWISNADEALLTNDKLEVIGVISDYLRRALFTLELKEPSESTVAKRMGLYEHVGTEWLQYVLVHIVPLMVEHDLPRVLSVEDFKVKKEVTPSDSDKEGTEAPTETPSDI